MRPISKYSIFLASLLVAFGVGCAGSSAAADPTPPVAPPTATVAPVPPPPAIPTPPESAPSLPTLEELGITPVILLPTPTSTPRVRVTVTPGPEGGRLENDFVDVVIRGTRLRDGLVQGYMPGKTVTPSNGNDYTFLLVDLLIINRLPYRVEYNVKVRAYLPDRRHLISLYSGEIGLFGETLDGSRGSEVLRTVKSLEASEERVIFELPNSHTPDQVTLEFTIEIQSEAIIERTLENPVE